MSTPPVAIPTRRPSSELKDLLTTMLSCGLGPAHRIRALEHRPSAVRSSFMLEEVDVIVNGGELLRLVLKVLGSPGLQVTAGMAKPLFLHDPLREIELYRHILSERPEFGAAMLYSTVVEPEHDRYWLLLERAPGRELSRIKEVEAWRAAARWLAAVHAELAPLVDYPSLPGVARLLRYDRDLLRMWIVRAQSIVRAQDALLPAQLRMGMNRLVGRYDRVVDRLLTMPDTIVHGEFHASNIVVRQEPGATRICALDWEMAGIGPHLLDLAALLVDVADEARRRDIALTYRAALPTDVRELRNQEEFLEDLAYCRLHLAVQWLGWSPDAATPTYRAEEWLARVLHLANELDL